MSIGGSSGNSVLLVLGWPSVKAVLSRRCGAAPRDRGQAGVPRSSLLIVRRPAAPRTPSCLSV